MKRVYIIALVIIVAGVIIYLLLPDIRNKKTTPNINKNRSEKFTTEGSLVFVSGNNSDTLGTIYFELAKDLYAQARGLMYRYDMPDSTGMLFVYEDMDHRSFWMKNTHIPLDIIFINDNKKIVHIHDYAIPYSEDLIPSKKPARYIVEVNAGYTDKYGIEVGDIISYTLFK